jgi:hypothetical protein
VETFLLPEKSHPNTVEVFLLLEKRHLNTVETFSPREKSHRNTVESFLLPEKRHLKTIAAFFRRQKTFVSEVRLRWGGAAFRTYAHRQGALKLFPRPTSANETMRGRLHQTAAGGVSAPSCKMKDVFNDIYRHGGWGTGSGEGSSPAYTNRYRRFLQDYMRLHQVRSVLDIGCGDWQFSHLIDWAGIRYTGIDVSSVVVDGLHPQEGIHFLCVDAVNEPLPAGDFDLVLIKDVLQHLSMKSVHTVLGKLAAYRRVVVTNDVQIGPNTDCEDGQYRPIDITDTPFNVRAIPVMYFGFHGKTVMEWLPPH